MEAVTWAYDGSGELVVTVTGAVDGDFYRLSTDDFTSTPVTDVAASGTVVLTQSAIGGVGAGYRFGAYVEHGDSGGVTTGDDCIAANIFTFGVADTIGSGYVATWDYDGSIVQVTFTAEGGITYTLGTNIGGTTDGPFTDGTEQTLSFDASGFSAGVMFFALLYDNAGAAAEYSNRLFTADAASAGAEGNPTTEGGGGGGLPLLPAFTVRNREHDGTLISTVTPIAGTLEWTYRLAQVGGPGEAQWSVALSDAGLGTDDFAPKRTDFELVMDASEVLMAGPQGPVHAGSEAGSGLFGQILCLGLDWLAYLLQPFGFPYEDIADDQAGNQLTDLANLGRAWISSAGSDGDGVTYSATQQDFVEALLASLSGYEDAVAYTPSFEGTGWTEPFNDQIMAGDSQNLLDLLVGLASLEDPYGFDAWCEPDKTVRLAAPRLVAPGDAVALYTFDSSDVISPPLDWTNNGPAETDTFVLGAGSGNTRTPGFSKYQDSRDTYRRWVGIHETNFPGPVENQQAAEGIGYLARFPHKDLKVRFRPDLVDPDDTRAGFRCFLARMVAVTYAIRAHTTSTLYHTIAAFFWVTEQRYFQPDGVNWQCDLTLSQVYATDADPSP